MANLNFDATEVVPSAGFDPLPAGKYVAVIEASENKPTRNQQGHYLELTFVVIEGEYANRRLWARLNLDNPNPKAVEMARADLSAICRAVDVMRPTDSEDLHNIPLVIRVKCRKREDTGEITNEVGGYEARTQGGEALKPPPVNNTPQHAAPKPSPAPRPAGPPATAPWKRNPQPAPAAAAAADRPPF